MSETKELATEPAEPPECSNKYCLDGWVDHEVGSQDGWTSYVEQVPCRVCGVHCDPDEE